jgi:ABC-type molybdate transport system substrate-binding protein
MSIAKVISGVMMIPLFLLLNSCSRNSKLQVHVASSIYPAIQLLKDSLDLDIDIQQGATGIIHKQLLLGQEADIVVIIQKEWLNQFQQDFSVKETKLIAKNRLCLISKKDSLLNVQEALNSNSLGLANPDFVPLGYYSLQIMQWYTDSVITPFLFNSAAQVKKMIDLGEIPKAIVYQSQVTKEYFQYCFPNSIQPDIRSFCLRMNDKENSISIFNQLTSSNAIKLISLEDQVYLK